jgi:serine/threonine protein kinase/WD40 repeat protein
VKTVNVIEAVFFAALEKKEAGERAAYLERACNGDPDLRRCVEKLLAAQPKVGEFLQAPAAGLPAAGPLPPVDHIDERPGTVLGPYKLLHEIGEGGMGTVWMAEQTEPVKRRVALKVIKPGMDSRQVLARFEAERQALALMDHPNIAKVFDAGATDGGRPYFVMELVKGQTITEFCDQNRLTTRERLELFVAVCNAIQHAHQKGVIHRDIKPSNVLVALYDGKPVPKVIDFGVAKAIGDPLTDKTLFTRHGQVVGTFEYMSPEQATLDQLDIDTRSDVYSLGVLLYELLTGTTPLDKDELRRGGLAEVLRRIREQEPPKPSTRLTSSPGLLAVAAAHRKSDSQKLPRAVRGELDWIVMKALDKDRNRRFESANNLAADVERFLKDEPVQACPPTLAYRFRKWARKNRVAFTTGSAIASALLVGLALTSWQAVRATSARRETVAEQGRTQTALDDALRIGKELDARLLDIQTANAQIRREQAQRRADQYAWDMQMLPLTWEDNNAREARQMLERQIPKPGEIDLRHFEWHYLNRQTHPEHAAFTLPDAADPDLIRGSRSGETAWSLSHDGGRVAHLFLPISVGTNGRNDVRGRVKVWDVATRKLLLNHELAEDERTTGIGGNLLSFDGKVVLLSGTTFRDVPDPGQGGPPSRGGVWVCVLEVDTQKVLFDSRKEIPHGRLSTSALISSDGRKLVTQEFKNLEGIGETSERYYSSLQCKVWDLGAADRKPVILEGVNIWRLNADGSSLTGTTWVDGKVATKFWDTATGKEVEGWEYLPALTVLSHAFSPNGTLVATIDRDLPEPGKGAIPTKRQLKVYEANSGKERFVYDVGSYRFGWATSAVFFTPDSSKIAVVNVNASRGDFGRTNGRTEWLILDARSGEKLARFDDPGGARSPTGPDPKTPALFSADGTLFILAVNNVVHTFDTTTGLPVHVLRGCENVIADMVVLPDAKLRTIEPGGTVREWNLARVKEVRTAIVELPRPAKIGRGDFAGGSSSAVSADGARVAVFTRKVSDEGTVENVRVWDAAGKDVVELKVPPRELPAGLRSFLSMPQLSADGQRVALFRNAWPDTSGPGGKVEKIDPTTIPPPDVIVWDVASKDVIFQREFPRNREDRVDTVVALSPDGTTLAVVHREGDGEKLKSTLTFVGVNTKHDGKPIEVVGTIGTVSFSPDSKRLEGGVNAEDRGVPVGNQVVVWDVATGSRICAIENVPSDPSIERRPPGTPAPLPAFARVKCWNNDGTRLAIVGPGRTQIHLFDTTTGKLARSLDVSTRGGWIPPSFRGGSLAFNPDGRRIACLVTGRSGQSSTVNVIDTESGKELLSLPQTAGSFQPGTAGIFQRGLAGESMRFTPDGHRLLFFTPIMEFSTAPAGVPPGRYSYLRVITWDATPLPEQPK